jgi:predicted amidohydrolase
VKTHPFSLSGEDRVFEKGNELQTCDFGGATVGLTICYDLRFPELYQGLSKTCGVIVNIANWASKRTLHWNVLLQARAIENQVFMIGVNRTGSAPDGQSYDHSSAIFGPFGNPIAPLEEDGEYGVYTIDLEEVTTVRSAYSVKSDRRVDWYKTLL